MIPAFQQRSALKTDWGTTGITEMKSEGMVVDGAWVTAYRNQQDEDKWVKNLDLFHKWKHGKNLRKDWATIGVHCQGVDIAQYFYVQWLHYRKVNTNDPRVNAMITEGMIVDEVWAGTIERKQYLDDIFGENIKLFKQ